ncbi:MAG: hypothetical protein WAQ25_00335 [Candidatus Saccharimonas sp.]
MNPWIAAYLGAHVMAMIAILTAWTTYLPRLADQSRFAGILWRVTLMIFFPVVHMATVGAFWLFELLASIWKDGGTKGFHAVRDEMVKFAGKS